MKKSEMIAKMIEIEKKIKQDRTITMNYLEYLKMQKMLVEIGDIELDTSSTERICAKCGKDCDKLAWCPDCERCEDCMGDDCKSYLNSTKDEANSRTTKLAGDREVSPKAVAITAKELPADIHTEIKKAHLGDDALTNKEVNK